MNFDQEPDPNAVAGEVDLVDDATVQAHQDAAAPSQESATSDTPPFTSVDFNSLPPELQRRYRQMEADYTRKTQEISEVRKKANAFDLLAKNPAGYWQAMFGPQAGNGNGNGSQPSLPPPSQPIEDPELYLGKLEPDAVKGVTALLDKWKREQLDPVFQVYRGHVDDMIQENVRQRWDALTKTYPGAERFQVQIAEFLRANPTVKDLKQAFFAVAGETALQEARVATSRTDTAARQQAQLTRSAAASHKTEPVQRKLTLAEHFEEAMKKSRLVKTM